MLEDNNREPSVEEKSVSDSSTPSTPFPSAKYRPAKGLYDFEGNPSYNELSFSEGDELAIVRDYVADGWCLAEKDGTKGLIPTSYIEYLDSSNDDQVSNASEESPVSHQGNGSSTAFGKKQFNRFAYFVTSGTEEFILKGSKEQPDAKDTVPESDKHFIQSGPSWQEKTGEFIIEVHSPTKIRGIGTQEYVTYQVTSIFPNNITVTAERRYSQFVWLHNKLEQKFGALILPALPGKQIAGRFSNEFIERRRHALERYMNRLARHPVIRYAEILTHFLSCNDDQEWKYMDEKFSADPIVGAAFYQHVYHPEFNVEEDGDAENVERFQQHIKSMDRYVPMLQESFRSYTEAHTEFKNKYRSVSLGLLRIITGAKTGSLDCVNEEGAWCWREDCKECLKLTKAIQQTTETMQTIADFHEAYVKDTLIEWEENLRDYNGMNNLCSPLLDIHSGAVDKHIDAEEVEGDVIDAETIKSRCETVFNVVLAEIETVHEQKVTDFKESTIHLLDREIELHEKVLAQLKLARGYFEEKEYSQLGESPRECSKYEKDLEEKPTVTRPASVSSVSSVVGGVFDGVGSVGHFLKNKARSSIVRSSVFSEWGWGPKNH
ncbi:hypothetical protein K493DRAFT_318594 [Basidiobolus meristosporus CBS 931.73]|uniref:PX-domain-containing protein n=1 Tax=Basidiobolus meristosporus CBS 931.73 TaxID=1314790 RepID=A0A1Y1XUZ5_9FUNG|nr:hypothetical protein K493DRAFT_318594 [Basidiobolus meristosporus CBS 931.73]|eukprot:ORX89579.1 hypothetical protein K493DRAFT_318594 [Basidiobolus meristosporus CBS 931.73]